MLATAVAVLFVAILIGRIETDAVSFSKKYTCRADIRSQTDVPVNAASRSCFPAALLGTTLVSSGCPPGRAFSTALTTRAILAAEGRVNEIRSMSHLASARFAVPLIIWPNVQLQAAFIRSTNALDQPRSIRAESDLAARLPKAESRKKARHFCAADVPK